MIHNLQATVFVYKHILTKKIQCEYIEKAKLLEDSPQWEHLGTLEPRMWIQEHWNDVESKDAIFGKKKVFKEIKQCLMCGDLDSDFQKRCTVPNCGIKEQQ